MIDIEKLMAEVEPRIEEYLKENPPEKMDAELEHELQTNAAFRTYTQHIKDYLLDKDCDSDEADALIKEVLPLIYGEYKAGTDAESIAYWVGF